MYASKSMNSSEGITLTLFSVLLKFKSKRFQAGVRGPFAKGDPDAEGKLDSIAEDGLMWMDGCKYDHY